MSNTNRNSHFEQAVILGLTLIHLVITPSAHAEGFGAGNSGTIVVCTDPETGAERATLLDIWEYTAAPHRTLTLTIGPQINSPHDPISLAIRRLLEATGNPPANANFLRSVLEDEVEYVMMMTLLTPLDVGTNYSIQYPAELLPAIRDPECAYHSVVSYQRDGRLITNRSLLDKITENRVLQLSGLVLHEAIYRIARDYRDVTDSTLVRELVAHLLSHENNPGRIRYLALTLLTPPTEHARFRIPHLLEELPGELGVRIRSRARRGSVTCQASASFLTENGVPFSTILEQQEIELESGQEMTIPLRINRGVTYGEYKVNQYQIQIDLVCDHPERLVDRSLVLSRQATTLSEYGHTGHYNPMEGYRNGIPIAATRSIIRFR